MKKTILFLFAAALMSAAILTSCWDVVLPEKVVVVGMQEGTLLAGTTGTVTFEIITTDIDASQEGTVQWYSDAAGANMAGNAPSGVGTISISTGSANRTLTIAVGEPLKLVAGTYWFRVVIDNVESNVGNLVIRN